MSFDENNIIFKQYFIPDKYDKSLIFSKTLQDYIAGIKGLKREFKKNESISQKVLLLAHYIKIHVG